MSPPNRLKVTKEVRWRNRRRSSPATSCASFAHLSYSATRRSSRSTFPSNHCTPPSDVRYKILKRLTENKRKNPGNDRPYHRALDAMDVAEHVSTDVPAAQLQAAPASGTSTGSSIVPFVNQLTTYEIKAIDTQCAKSIYRWALPLSPTESPDLITFAKALNAGSTAPSRYTMPGHS